MTHIFKKDHPGSHDLWNWWISWELPNSPNLGLLSWCNETSTSTPCESQYVINKYILKQTLKNEHRKTKNIGQDTGRPLWQRFPCSWCPWPRWDPGVLPLILDLVLLGICSFPQYLAISCDEIIFNIWYIQIYWVGVMHLTHLFLIAILEVDVIIPTYRWGNWNTNSKGNLLKVTWSKSNWTRLWSQVMWFSTQVFFAPLLILFCKERGRDMFRELQVAQSTGEKLEISLER